MGAALRILEDENSLVFAAPKCDSEAGKSSAKRSIGGIGEHTLVTLPASFTSNGATHFNEKSYMKE
jgi:hypothetical protein